MSRMARRSKDVASPTFASGSDWAFTSTDRSLARPLRLLLPDKLYDIHAHLYRVNDMGSPPPGLAAQGPPVVTRSVWRASLSRIVGRGRLAGGLFFPYPTTTGNIAGSNAFLVGQIKNGLDRGLILVTPQSSPKDIEAWLECPQVVGFKPYHFFAPGTQTFDAPLEAYAPEWIWRMAHDRRLVITIHLVRARALSDPVNRRSIRRLCAKYPGVRLILAHAARGFHAPNTLNGLDAIEGLDNVWFDTSAICEPETFMAILKRFGPQRLLWGSDFPVSQQRGRCVTVGDAFSWICPPRTDVDSAAPPCHPTLVGIESLRALLTGAQLLELTRQNLRDIFFGNAARLLGLPRSSGRG